MEKYIPYFYLNVKKKQYYYYCNTKQKKMIINDENKKFVLELSYETDEPNISKLLVQADKRLDFIDDMKRIMLEVMDLHFAGGIKNGS